MKRIANYLIVLALAVFAFTSCEDVPSPFGQVVAPKTDDVEVIEPSGKGTLAEPYNVAGVIEYLSGLGADVTSPTDVYIKGVITSITEAFGTQYGNATFEISDTKDAPNKFLCYRVKYFGGQGYSDATALNIKQEDEVIICGKVVNYMGNTPETSANAAYVYSINGKGGGDTPTPTDEVKKVTIAEFNAASESSTQYYQLTGTVKNLKDGDQYGNFDLEDATGSVYVYGLLAEKGGESMKFQELAAAKGIKNGVTLTINGLRSSYNDKIQVKSAYFVSVESGSGGGGGGTSGGGGSAATALTNGDFETWANGLPTGWKSASTASSATLTQSTDAHGGKYSCNVNGDESQNKRLASQEITLAAGTYVFSAWIKATTSDVAQARPGYVPIGADGKAGSYAYGDYANLTTSWQQFSYEFTLDSEKTVCLVIMNPKKSSYSSGKDILVDDATLTKK